MNIYGQVGWRAAASVNPFVTDADALAFVTAATITNPTQQTAIDTLVKALKSANIWTKMKAIYPFVGGTAAQHRFNLKDPRPTNEAFYLDFIGGGTHGPNGYQPNGTTAYANTKLIPSAVYGAQNPILHYSIYNRTSLSITSTQWADGVYSLTGIGGIALMQNSFTTVAPGNSSALIGSSDPGGTLTGFSNNTDGNFVFSRTSNTSLKAYRNGTLVGTKTTDIGSDTYVPRTVFLIGARNDSYDMALRPNSLNPLEKAFATIGTALTDAEATAFYNAVQAYQTTLGRAV
jgi:hypothetical protein